MNDELWIAVNTAGVPDLATLHVDETGCIQTMDEIGLMGFEPRCTLVIHDQGGVDAVSPEGAERPTPPSSSDLANRLFAAIAHGDDVHRAWLREALDAFFVGKEMPAVRSRASSSSSNLVKALEEVEQRANESGTGEMGLLDTIHAMHGIARSALRSHRGDKSSNSRQEK